MNSYNLIIYDENNEELWNGNIKAKNENEAIKKLLEFCIIETGDTIEIYKGE